MQRIKRLSMVSMIKPPTAPLAAIRKPELAEREGFEPTVLFRYSRFPGVRLKPLSHLSGSNTANLANPPGPRNFFPPPSRPFPCISLIAASPADETHPRDRNSAPSVHSLRA